MPAYPGRPGAGCRESGRAAPALLSYGVGSPRPFRFTLNTMVLLPLLRSLPPSFTVSTGAALAAMTGLDFGLLGLGHPETAADDLVALLMAFSVVLPFLWVAYMAANAWNWAAGVLEARRQRRP